MHNYCKYLMKSEVFPDKKQNFVIEFHQKNNKNM